MHRTLPEQCLLKRGVSDQGLFELQYSHILLEVKSVLYDAMEFQKPCQMPLQIYLVQFQSFVLLPLALPLEGLIRKQDRKSTRLNSSHVRISYAVFCLKKKKIK